MVLFFRLTAGSVGAPLAMLGVFMPYDPDYSRLRVRTELDLARKAAHPRAAAAHWAMAKLYAERIRSNPAGPANVVDAIMLLDEGLREALARVPGHGTQ